MTVRFHHHQCYASIIQFSLRSGTRGECFDRTICLKPRHLYRQSIIFINPLFPRPRQSQMMYPRSERRPPPFLSCALQSREHIMHLVSDLSQLLRRIADRQDDWVSFKRYRCSRRWKAERFPFLTAGHLVSRVLSTNYLHVRHLHNLSDLLYESPFRPMHPSSNNGSSFFICPSSQELSARLKVHEDQKALDVGIPLAVLGINTR